VSGGYGHTNRYWERVLHSYSPVTLANYWVGVGDNHCFPP
jgi:hypothetical protein